MRAGDVIRRLRDFVARRESDRQVERLPSLIEDTSSLALVGAREADVRVSYEFDPAAELVLMDRIQIQQVLLNLMRNAAEAMQLRHSHNSTSPGADLRPKARTTSGHIFDDPIYLQTPRACRPTSIRTLAVA